MTKILVLYYSSYGHTSTMAEAVAEGVREAGAEAFIRHVPETAPEEVAKNAGFTGMPGHDEIADGASRNASFAAGQPDVFDPALREPTPHRPGMDTQYDRDLVNTEEMHRDRVGPGGAIRLES